MGSPYSFRGPFSVFIVFHLSACLVSFNHGQGSQRDSGASSSPQAPDSRPNTTSSTLLWLDPVEACGVEARKLAPCDPPLQVSTATFCGRLVNYSHQYEPESGKTVVAVQVLQAVCQGHSALLPRLRDLLDTSTDYIPRESGSRSGVGRVARPPSPRRRQRDQGRQMPRPPSTQRGKGKEKGKTKAKSKDKGKQSALPEPPAAPTLSPPSVVQSGAAQSDSKHAEMLHALLAHKDSLPENIQHLLSQQMDADMAAGKALQKHVKSQTSKAKQLATLRGQRAAYVQEWDRYVQTLNETLQKQMAERETTLAEFAKTEAEL